MKTYYCWRCKQDMPFLNEEKWEAISLLLTKAIKDIKHYREKHGCDIATAKSKLPTPVATEVFEKLTGMADVDYEVIYHHQLSRYGPKCDKCGHLIRTNKASKCMNCGKKTGFNESL